MSNFEQFNTIEEVILNDLTMYDSLEEKISYLQDVTTHGCVSGIVSDLIYYNDTQAFYTRFEEKIIELVEEMDFDLNNLKGKVFSNELAWFGYEIESMTILNELEENMHVEKGDQVHEITFLVLCSNESTVNGKKVKNVYRDILFFENGDILHFNPSYSFEITDIIEGVYHFSITE